MSGANLMNPSRHIPILPEIVQSKKATFPGASKSSIAATFDTSPIKDNLLVVMVTGLDSGVSTLTPSGWTVVEKVNGTSSILDVYYKVAGASESSTVTVSYDGGPHNGDQLITIYEIKNTKTTAPFDVEKSTKDGGTTAEAPTGTTLTTTFPNEFAIAFCNSFGGAIPTVSWSNGYTEDYSVDIGNLLVGVATKILQSLQTTGTTWTFTTGGVGDTVGLVATFKGKQ